MKKSYTIVLVLFLICTSCVSKKKMVYFGGESSMNVVNDVQQFDPTIKAGDLLNIHVSSINAEAALPFNIYETPVSGTFASNSKPIPYLVNSSGDINFPVIGTLKVEGSTTKELDVLLVEKISEYITNPIVNIRITNFRVTILGEVKAPGTYTVPNERISVIEALGLAGDLTIQGNRKNIKLIREKDGKRMTIPIDLTQEAFLDSPDYFISQNDVIYVEPNKAKVNSSAVGANAGLILSSISTLISLIAILTR